MAFKCIMSCYAGRLFEEGVVYDSRGRADKKYFEEVVTEGIETGLLDDIPDTGPLVPGTNQPLQPPVEPEMSEYQQLKSALDELGVDYAGNASKQVLKELLLAKQQEGFTS